MLSMVSVLRRGLMSFDRRVLPPDEYRERVRAIQRLLHERGADCAVLVGDPDAYAAPCYVSGLSDGSAVVVPQAGDPVIVMSSFFWRELPIRRTLTWISDIRVAESADSLPDLLSSAIRDATDRHEPVVATCGFPDSCEPETAHAIGKALAWFNFVALDEEFLALRLSLRPREVRMLGEIQSVAMRAADEAVTAFKAGADNDEASLIAERYVRMSGALDVRVLANLESDSLQPLDRRTHSRRAELVVYVAVDRQGYWADAIRSSASPSLARKALDEMGAAAGRGATTGDVAAAALAVLPADVHATALSYGLGGAIGLGLNEPLVIAPQTGRPLPLNCVLSLHVITDAGSDAAGAMVQVTPSGAFPITAV